MLTTAPGSQQALQERNKENGDSGNSNLLKSYRFLVSSE